MKNLITALVAAFSFGNATIASAQDESQCYVKSINYYVFSWDDILTKDEILDKIDHRISKGIETITNARKADVYLSEYTIKEDDDPLTVTFKCEDS